MESPLTSLPLFMIGPVPIMPAVVVTWVIMTVLVLGAVILARRLTLVPSPSQAAVELLVSTVDGQINDMTGAAPGPYRAIVGSPAALIVPIPLMALDLLTGAVQAYIFAILSIVFTASAVEKGAPRSKAS